MISHVYRRLHRKKPSTTIIAGGGGGTWGYHFEEPRPLTNRERARLFCYPDDFIFKGTITEVRKQIGNSVPPLAAKVVAEHLLSAFSASSMKKSTSNAKSKIGVTLGGSNSKKLRAS
jgi:DNA (cytosine-5)-methyltransferase 1